MASLIPDFIASLLGLCQEAKGKNSIREVWLARFISSVCHCYWNERSKMGWIIPQYCSVEVLLSVKPRMGLGAFLICLYFYVYMWMDMIRGDTGIYTNLLN